MMAPARAGKPLTIPLLAQEFSSGVWLPRSVRASDRPRRIGLSKHERRFLLWATADGYSQEQIAQELAITEYRYRKVLDEARNDAKLFARWGCAVRHESPGDGPTYWVCRFLRNPPPDAPEPHW
jgi:hypothetical protein